jgi:hypothetical protein
VKALTSRTERFGVGSKSSRIEERVVMTILRSQPTPRATDLDVDDLTQEIDAPLEDFLRRDDPTLTKIDFDELEIKLEF